MTTANLTIKALPSQSSLKSRVQQLWAWHYQEQRTSLPLSGSLPLLNLSGVSGKQLAPSLSARLLWIFDSMLMQGGMEKQSQDRGLWTVAEFD